MDLSESLFNKKSENEESNVSMVNNDCEEYSFSCTSFSGPVDTSKMSEDNYDLFKFNSEVLYLTESLWKRLLKISDLEYVLLEEDLCYSIIDATNCNTLNKYFLSFYYYMIGYQRTNIDSNDRKKYLDLLNNTLSSLENFLKSTLPYLQKNVAHLIFKIKRSNSEKITNSSHKAENFGKEANNAIHLYLNQLRKAVMNFEIINVPAEILEKKIRTEREIHERYMDKSFLLEIPINEEDIQNYDNINHSEESYDHDTTTDFYDNFISLESGDATDYFNTTSNYIAYEGFETTENFKTTENFETTRELDVFVQNVKFYNHDLTALSSSENLEAEGLGNSNNIIIIGSIVTFIGLIGVLIVFYIRKLMRKKEKRIKECEDMHLEEEQSAQKADSV